MREGGRSGWRMLAAFLLGMAIAGPLGMYLEGGTRLVGYDVSPDGLLRAETYEARRWQVWQHPLRYDAWPGFVRITKLAGGEALSESPVFELSDSGPVTWDKRTVMVGTSAQFDLVERRWTML
ncbi:hypothetical protein ACFSGX_17200 [Sphingomonas arantia]|uniref:Uncharacterized protein n=1 Tax=Sphingomonas arantia TaxID=1460676 RepID=A0ABW4U0Q8_9SPHN